MHQPWTLAVTIPYLSDAGFLRTFDRDRPANEAGMNALLIIFATDTNRNTIRARDQGALRTKIRDQRPGRPGTRA